MIYKLFLNPNYTKNIIIYNQYEKSKADSQ